MNKQEIVDNLSKYFGFGIPEDFAELILHVLKNSIESDEKFDTYFDFIFDFWINEKVLAGEVIEDINDDSYLGYNSVPVEFFPFAGPKLAGVAYGFIVIAPELKLKEYPIAEFYPAGDGVTFLGEDTKSAFKYLMSIGLKYSSVEYKTIHYGAHVSDQVLNQFKLREQRAFKKIAKVLELLNVDISAKISPYDISSYHRNHIVPINWRFEATSDGIGVLAHQSKFSPDFVYSQMPRFKSLYEEIKFIEQFLTQGYPATALWIIREIYWHGGFQRPFSELAPIWAKTYDALDRPLLSKRIIAAADFRDQL